MNLTPLQLFCQKQILKKLYPDLSLKDIKQKIKRDIDYNGGFETLNGDKPSLPRVLTALGILTVDNGGWGRAILYRDGSIYDYSYPDLDEQQKICDWKLLNEDLSDATLFDQSEETIEAIGKLLGYNE